MLHDDDDTILGLTKPMSALPDKVVSAYCTATVYGRAVVVDECDTTRVTCGTAYIPRDVAFALEREGFADIVMTEDGEVIHPHVVAYDYAEFVSDGDADVIVYDVGVINYTGYHPRVLAASGALVHVDSGRFGTQHLHIEVRGDAVDVDGSHIYLVDVDILINSVVEVEGGSVSLYGTISRAGWKEIGFDPTLEEGNRVVDGNVVVGSASANAADPHYDYVGREVVVTVRTPTAN